MGGQKKKGEYNFEKTFHMVPFGGFIERIQYIPEFSLFLKKLGILLVSFGTV